MQYDKSIDRALTALDYALIVAEPGQYIVAARKELLNLKIDLAIQQDVTSVTSDLPPLEGTDGPPERYRKKQEKLLYEKLEGRSLTYSQSSSTKKATAKSVKCPTCGSPPWHYCVRVSNRGGGSNPIGTKQINDHHERRLKAQERFEKESKG